MDVFFVDTHTIFGKHQTDYQRSLPLCSLGKIQLGNKKTLKAECVLLSDSGFGISGHLVWLRWFSVSSLWLLNNEHGNQVKKVGWQNLGI